MSLSKALVQAREAIEASDASRQEQLDPNERLIAEFGQEAVDEWLVFIRTGKLPVTSKGLHLMAMSIDVIYRV